MGRRVSEEVRIINFFRNATLEVAESVLSIARATVKERQNPGPVRVRRARKARKVENYGTVEPVRQPL